MDNSAVFADKQSIRARAFEIIKKHSFRFGDFTLSSGGTYNLNLAGVETINASNPTGLETLNLSSALT